MGKHKENKGQQSLIESQKRSLPEKRLYRKRAAGILLTLLLILGGLLLLDRLTRRTDSRDQYQDFYDLDTNVDVLFLGSSHAMRAISPMDLWEEYGITSYNLATTGCRIGTSYWILKNALQYTSPSLVVVDCAYLQDVKANPKTGYGHRVFDSMPFGSVKLEALRDLYPDRNDFLGFLIPFTIYHNRWDEISLSRLKPYRSKGMMGFWPEWLVADRKLTEFSTSEAVPVDNLSTQYLEKIVQTCQDQGIQVMLMTVPFWENETSLNDVAWIRELAGRWGISYLSPEEIYSWVSRRTDFTNHYENNSHLNWKGAQTVSHRIGPILRSYDGVEDHSEDSGYRSWDDRLERYREFKLNTMRKVKWKPQSYLLLAADPHYRTEVEIYNPKVPGSRKYRYLLKSLKTTNIESTQKLVEGTQGKRMTIRVYDKDDTLLDEKMF